ncbi:MAG: M23 family metallopeptidase [Betaproteobacteria bacterium]|nr:M23 family metallopeptidase [Betaproteobacteria bacterium]
MRSNRSIFSHLPKLPGLVKHVWTREYQDVRLILEQSGDLRYFNIPGGFQRFVAKSSVAAGFVLIGTIIFLLTTTLVLGVSRARLERSHEEVYRALLSSTNDGGSSDASLNEEQMVTLAQTIRDRDMSIRRFVETSMVTVSEENETLKAQLETSGLTEKIIKIIQQNSANGGFSLDTDLQSNPLLSGKVAEELSTNRALREVLYALPNRMPVNNFNVSSDFGIRKHPLTGKTHFHTGLDLMSETGDDKVFAVKPGVVVLAEFHPQYGNTVMIRHLNGVESLYAHMAQLNVKVGDKVTTESLLGYIGNTGASSTGKHLHLEILVGGYPVNPQKVIRTAQYVQQIQNSNKQ